MTDGYDLLCMMELEKRRLGRTVASLNDEAICACAKYLNSQGYHVQSETLPCPSLTKAVQGASHGM